MLNPDYRDMLAALRAESVEFLLVGAFALAAHGLPCATGDIDIWPAAPLTTAGVSGERSPASARDP